MTVWTTGRCLACDRSWLHCHGTAVVHPDGGRECTDAACGGDAELHDLVLGCAELVGGCDCLPSGR